MSSKIIFIYNANTDPISAAVDYAHKVFKPSTYKCELCSLTHHNLGQRSAWKAFKARTEADLEFWYIRQFEKRHKAKYEYPIILNKVSNGFEVLMSKQEIAELTGVEELIQKLENITTK